MLVTFILYVKQNLQKQDFTELKHFGRSTSNFEKTNICLIVHTQVELKFKCSYLIINLMT